MPEQTTVAEVLERATTFEWSGDTSDEVYYAFVCDLLEVWDSDGTPPESVLSALSLLHADHDDHHAEGFVQLAQNHMTLWFQTRV